MSNLYSSDGDIKFYNYISPSFYSGVPVGSVDKNIFEFLSEHAFDSLDYAINGTDYISLRFPKVVGTPTEAEATTAQVTTTSVNRFAYKQTTQDPRSIATGDTNKRIAISHSAINFNSTPSRADIMPVKLNASGGSTALDGSTRDILFITKSPSTMIFGECRFDVNSYSSLTESAQFSIAITGWMHDSIFLNSSNPIAGFYCMVFSTRSSSLFNANQNFKRLNTTASNATVTLEHRYYDITCQAGTGTYTGQEVFLTDIILYDSGSPAIQIGKIDNRIACLGRGNLQQGRIYRTTNPFGRTGTEYWLCLGSYTPDETKWQKTPSDLLLPASLFRTWDINNRDYILMRIQLRPDLP